MTAIGCRAAAAGLTSSPVSGAGTSVGPGVGVGRGGRLGVGVGLPDPAAPLDGVAVGDSEGGVLPSAAMLPEPFGVEADGAPMAAVSIPKAAPPSSARTASTANAARFTRSFRIAGSSGIPSIERRGASSTVRVTGRAVTGSGRRIRQLPVEPRLRRAPPRVRDVTGCAR